VIAVGLVVAAACALLGRWQWTRHVQRAERADLVEANYDAPPVDLGSLLARPGVVLDPGDVWRPVRVDGAYAAGGTVVLRARPVDGQPAVHALNLLVVASAGAQALLVVDRGWLPAGSEQATQGLPAPPSGPVSAVVRLRPVEPPGRQGPPGQVYRIDPEGVLAAAAVSEEVRALPVLDAYGVLADQDPPGAVPPTPLPRPDVGLGPHLSYAFQWWVFAVGALVGVVVLARREAAALDEPAQAPPGRRGARRRSAEDEEDALVDAQLAVRAAAGGAAGNDAGHPPGAAGDLSRASGADPRAGGATSGG
jgi:cytochrome oxidase assembly protein ShyY1